MENSLDWVYIGIKFLSGISQFTWNCVLCCLEVIRIVCVCAVFVVLSSSSASGLKYRVIERRASYTEIN